MARILLCPWPLSGQSLAMVALAKRLRDGGHTVLFTGIPDVGEFTEPDALPFAPVFERELPRGYLRREREQLGAGSGPRRWLRHANVVRAAGALLRKVTDGCSVELGRVLRSYAPDLVIVSSSSTFPAFLALEARRFGIPAAYLTTIPWHREHASIPPPTSSILPSAASRWRVRAAWMTLFARMRVHRAFAALAGLDIEAAILREADGVSAHHAIERRSLLAPLLPIPELVAFPRELEFDGASAASPLDVGALVDLDRRADEVPRPFAESRRPLVYCTLGTLPYLSARGVAQFVRSIVETFTRRDDCSVIVNLAGQADAASFAPPPRHIALTDRAPQLDCIRRASLVISHAGVNTVKESLYFGVPMIVFPLGFDHAGVAARVVAHGVGIRGSLRNGAPRALAQLVDRALGDAAMRTNADVMGRAMRASDTPSRCLDAVESLLSEEEAGRVRHRRVS